MKKVLVVALGIMLVAGFAFADGDTVSKQVYSTAITNTAGVGATTVIPVTTIRPKVDKLIGYSVRPIGQPGSEVYIGIFDDTTVGVSGECLAENEAANKTAVSELWPFGKYIGSGLVVTQGASTEAVIYFVRE